MYYHGTLEVDPTIHLEAAQRGAYVAFDAVTLISLPSPASVG